MSSERLVWTSYDAIEVCHDHLKNLLDNQKSFGLGKYDPVLNTQDLGDFTKILGLDFKCRRKNWFFWVAYLLVPLISIGILVSFNLFFPSEYGKKLTILGSGVIWSFGVIMLDMALRLDDKTLNNLEKTFWEEIKKKSTDPPVIYTVWSSPRSDTFMLKILSSVITGLAAIVIFGFSLPTLIVVIMMISQAIDDGLDKSRMSSIAYWKVNRLRNFIMLSSFCWFPILALYLANLFIQFFNSPDISNILWNPALPMDDLLSKYGDWSTWVLYIIGIIISLYISFILLGNNISTSNTLLGEFQKYYSYTVLKLREYKNIAGFRVGFTTYERLSILTFWFFNFLISWTLALLTIYSLLSFILYRIDPNSYPWEPIVISIFSLVFLLLPGSIHAYAVYKLIKRVIVLIKHPSKLLKSRRCFLVPSNLHEIVGTLCTIAKISIPEIIIVNDKSINAQFFGVGTTGKNKILEITLGSLLFLDDDELLALIAHEIGHAKYDTSTIHIHFLSAISLGGISFLNALIDYTSREFSADEFAVRIIGNSDGLVSLISKIQEIKRVFHQKNQKEEKERNSISTIDELVDAFFFQHLQFYYHPTLAERLSNIAVVCKSLIV